MSRKLSLTGLLGVLALGASGCLPFWQLWHDDWDEEDPPVPVAGPIEPGTAPPSVDEVLVADWPPIGPAGTVAARVSDDYELDSVVFSFRNEHTVWTSGTSAEVSASGLQLGEGFGTLAVMAVDSRGGTATRQVADLLVDLTPPEIYLGPTVLAASLAEEGGSLELWVADAWVLGRVELEFGGALLSHDFIDGYPSTLGTGWDFSLVKFPVAELPVTSGLAHVVATDAAGNTAATYFNLTIDGEAPSVTVLSPAPGTIVTGAFTVAMQASDPGGGPVSIELTAGGAPLASVLGPKASVTLEASELVLGPIELGAVAVDQAGNRSEPKVVPIVVAAP
jgi:hypothetical protein